jgi:ABC-type cobalamin/Fe3+-siderophores transport system ATPase subunit
MTFPFDININLGQTGISGIQNPAIKIYGGVTTFLGPNGAGKTQLLRGLKHSLNAHFNGKK